MGWSSWPTWWAFAAPLVMLALMVACMAGGCCMMRGVFGRRPSGPAGGGLADTDFARSGPHVSARFPEGASPFEEYRAETLGRLDREQTEFHGFLDRLRGAKDKAEFDQFMAERRARPDSPTQG